MKNFDDRWQQCAARARRAPARPEVPPLGFTTRVLARQPAAEPGLQALWERLALRWLAGAAAVLAVCAALELPDWHRGSVLAPGIENTVEQVVWKL